MEESFEYQIFALCLKEKGAISYFADQLDPDVVGLPSGNTGIHEFYQNLLEFYRRTGLDPVNPIAFQEWLKESDLSAAMGGESIVASYVVTMLQIEDLATPESIAAILRFRANKRKQLDSLQELQLLLSKKDYKTDEDTSKISFLTQQIRDIEAEIGYDPLISVETANDIALRANSLWDLPDFLPTQFPELNKCLGYDSEKGGFCKGTVNAIIARSGFGKSTLAKNLCNNWADRGLVILYINYEEAKAHWERILMTQLIEKNVYAGVTASEKERYTLTFQKKLRDWGDRFMVRHDPDTPYFDDLEKWLRDVIGHGEHIPDVVVIDTIQSMFLRGSGGRPRWGQFEEMMVRLEKLAKDMNAVFIITSQENSNRAKEKREVVQQSDAGGSLTIIQKSSVAIFITEQNKEDEYGSDDTLMELQIPKNRITGGRYMKQPPMIKYIDEIKSYRPYDLPPGDIYNDDVERDWSV